MKQLYDNILENARGILASIFDINQMIPFAF
jgi:hypothetical protein